jgi:hypothetical protein
MSQQRLENTRISTDLPKILPDTNCDCLIDCLINEDLMPKLYLLV